MDKNTSGNSSSRSSGMQYESKVEKESRKNYFEISKSLRGSEPHYGYVKQGKYGSVGDHRPKY